MGANSNSRTMILALLRLVVLLCMTVVFSAAVLALPPTSPNSQPHITYWFNSGEVCSAAMSKVLVIFQNETSNAMKFNGSNFYPEVELFTAGGSRVRTKDEVDSERTGSKIITAKDYIPDPIILPAHTTISHQYDFAPWQAYNLRPGIYIAKVKGTTTEFRFEFSR